MKQTAVEFMVKEISEILGPLKTEGMTDLLLLDAYNQAKAMESKERLKHQLFIGKVFEILDFDKTVELLKQCNDEII